MTSLAGKTDSLFDRRVNCYLSISRCTHNELEKNRRAHQRSLLGELQKRVDPGDDGVRATTLNILKRAYQEITVSNFH